MKQGGVDWRNSGKVTPVRDQAQCGSCWAFGSVAATESLILQKTTKYTSSNLDLSEQEVVDCAVGNKCNGGSTYNGLSYIQKSGITTEANYPYKAVAGTCKKYTKVARVGGIKTHTDKNENTLVSVVNSYVTTVGIDASKSSFQLYKSGIYNEPRCSTSTIDHTVTVVGYGDNYFIVKNSWGTSWGEKGYIKMTKNGSNQCCIACYVVYPTTVSLL